MFLQEEIKTRVEDAYDVIVAGGGFAGISAALAAAREGRRVLLLERQFLLGGLGTSGLVTIYLPLCDGMGRQVSFGIAEELFRLSISMGAEDRYPANWLDGVGTRGAKDPRFEVQFNPQLFAILAERKLLEAGVKILYGTTVVAVQKNADRIEHIIVENKSGRLAYLAGSVVDATGDCDVAHLAGAPTVNFSQGNVLAAWYYSTGREGYRLHMLGFCDIPEEEKGEHCPIERLDERRYTGLTGEELSEMVCASHSSTLNDIKKRRVNDPTLVPVTLATIPQVRMTRRIDGAYTLSTKEEHTYFADSVGMVSNWKRRGPVYEVPFRTLYSVKVKNLLCAGRCTSVEDSMWDVMRVIPCCAVTGEAAGTAAAMSTDVTTLSVEALQRRLREKSVRIHEDELYV